MYQRAANRNLDADFLVEQRPVPVRAEEDVDPLSESDSDDNQADEAANAVHGEQPPQ